MQDRNYNILLTQEAIHDIADIAEYIEIHFGPACADRFQERLKKELSQNEIHILRILRSERNWKRLLSSNHFYTYPDRSSGKSL